jgi:hypothetical protein
MMENSPIPSGQKAHGCYVCGQGKSEVLQSKTIQGTSYALCPAHIGATKRPIKFEPPEEE